MCLIVVFLIANSLASSVNLSATALTVMIAYSHIQYPPLTLGQPYQMRYAWSATFSAHIHLVLTARAG